MKYFPSTKKKKKKYNSLTAIDGGAVREHYYTFARGFIIAFDVCEIAANVRGLSRERATLAAIKAIRPGDTPPSIDRLSMRKELAV